MEALAQKLQARSLQLLAEWLKANRVELEKRMDSQDVKLAEIYSETRVTNGRVTNLERKSEIADALSTGRKKWHEELSRKWIALGGFAFTLLGGAIGDLLHHIGL